MFIMSHAKILEVINSHEAYDFLEENCDFIGSGAFTRAYAHPRQADRVIKYNWDCEDGSEAFARYCIKNPSNVHLPVIHVMNDCRTHRIIVQEKLSPLSDENQKLVSYIDMLICMNKFTGIASAINYAEIYPTEEQFISSLQDLMITKGYDAYLDCEQLSFIKAVYEITCHFGMYFDIDFSTDNVMQRGDDLVIMDPLAEILEYDYELQDA